MPKFHVYNSHTMQSVTVDSTSIAKAIAAGRKRLRPNKKGIVRAWRIK